MTLIGVPRQRRWALRIRLLRPKSLQTLLRLTVAKGRISGRFILDAVRAQGKPVVLVNSQPWHFNWNVQERMQVALKALDDVRPVRLDLFSRWQIRILAWLLRARPDDDIGESEIEWWRRSYHDIRIWTDPISAISQGDYREQADAQLHGSAVPRTWALFKGIVAQPTCRGLVITQQSTDDWPWALCVGSRGKSTYEPDGQFGSTVRTEMSLELDEIHTRQVMSALTSHQLERARLSLERRCAGDYGETSRANYMSLMTKTARESAKSEWQGWVPEVVLFLHAFGDTPNAKIYDFSRVPFVDYFEMSLFLVHELGRTGTRLGLKFHPLNGLYRGDHVFEGALRTAASQYPSVRVLSGLLTVDDVSAIAGVVGLTGRGSVITECAFREVPCANIIDCVPSRIGLSTLLDLQLGVREQIERVRCEPPNPNRGDIAVAYEAALLDAQQSRFFTLSDYSRSGKRNHLVTTYRRLTPLLDEA